MPGLKTLALPTCILLSNTSGDGQRPHKRIMSTRGKGRAPTAASAAEGRKYQ